MCNQEAAVWWIFNLARSSFFYLSALIVVLINLHDFSIATHAPHSKPPHHGNPHSPWQPTLTMATYTHHGNPHSPWQPTLTMATGMHRRRPFPRLQPERTWSKVGRAQRESAAGWAWGSTCQQRMPSSCQTSRGPTAREACTQWWRRAGLRWHRDIPSAVRLSTWHTVLHCPVQTEREERREEFSHKLPIDPKDSFL